MAMPQDYFGIGSIGRLQDILAQEKPHHIFLVHGKESYKASGADQKLSPLLTGYHVIHFTDFSSNAKVEDVEKGIMLFREQQGDFVIAIGGGSALDLGKAIALLADCPEKPEEYIKKKAVLHGRKIPLVAIPTTAGTGSEATHFAAIYVDKKKYSLAHPSLIPDYAIIDPSLTFSLPSYQTACTGMDALSQAIESYWSIHSTPESKRYAAKAIPLALAHLENAVCNPTPEARISMAKAANLAGKAINISFTTACHAVSYPITSYFNVPHGHAVALTLDHMFMYNAAMTSTDCGDPRGIDYVRRTMDELANLFGVSSPLHVQQRLQNLLDSIGLKRSLRELGISAAADIGLIIQHGFNPERVKNNPRLVTEESLRGMLERIK